MGTFKGAMTPKQPIALLKSPVSADVENGRDEGVKTILHDSLSEAAVDFLRRIIILQNISQFISSEVFQSGQNNFFLSEPNAAAVCVRACN